MQSWFGRFGLFKGIQAKKNDPSSLDGVFTILFLFFFLLGFALIVQKISAVKK